MNQERQIRNTRIKKGIYVLPNLITTASLFMGFYSIIASIQEKFFLAAIAILTSLVLDGLDGRIARITNTTSKFGAEYDSLSDMIAFGVAPSLLAYIWAMSSYGKLGWMAGFLFVTCGALRLARYNIQIGLIDSKVFNGLPIPAAAAVIATTVIFVNDIMGIEGIFHNRSVLILVIILSFLMVSNVKYYSGKDMKLFARMPFMTFLVVVGILLVIIYKPEVMIFVLFIAYAISGPLWWVFKLIQKLRGKDQNAEVPKQES
jgi:CDP-diacylglycerol--serine O-phosphatidyltransferase